MPDTALLVIDMQNAFCHPDGSVVGLAGPLAGIASVIEHAERAVEQARRGGVPVVFTRHCYRPSYVDSPLLDRTVDRAVRDAGGLVAGTADSAVIDELGSSSSDLFVDKCRPDAFFDTSLPTVLRSLGVKSLTFAGVVTNVCVESTVRGAHMRDYPCTILADCCTTRTEEDHKMSLTCLERYAFASVVWDSSGFDVATDRVSGPELAGPLPAA